MGFIFSGTPCKKEQTIFQNTVIILSLLNRQAMANSADPDLTAPSRVYTIFRDVIRSPDIRTFESHREVRTQFQHPEVRIKY